MATLKDVARLANVDVSTVSRALNNTSYVHPETRERIMAAVKELSYKPNLLAKGLRSGKRNTIGVVIPMLSFSIFAEVVAGIEDETRKHGYEVLICNTGDNKDTEKDSLLRLRNGFIDGLIIAGTGKNRRITRDINLEGMPVVQVIRKYDPTLSSVVADYKDVGYRSVMHMYERGCRRIGLINGSMAISPYADRYAGYKKAMAELGLEEITTEHASLLRGMKYGYESAVHLIDENIGLDAIMAATDAQGMGVIRALKENDVRIPDDIKVLSMTGHMVGDMLETSLTSMEIPGREIGRRAAEMLIRSIEADSSKKPAVSHLSFPAELAERESTADGQA